MSIDDRQPRARRPFLIAAKRKGRESSEPSFFLSDNIAYIEPRRGSESVRTFFMTNGGSSDSSGVIEAPIDVVVEIFKENGYAVYDSEAIDQRKKEQARKMIAPKV